MQPRQSQMCRYGETCNRFAQGTCKFIHPGQSGQGPQGGQGGREGMGGQQGPRMNQNRNFDGPNDGPRRQNYPPREYQGNPQSNFQPRQ